MKTDGATLVHVSGDLHTQSSRVRSGLLHRVYGLVCLQLGFTTCFVCLTSLEPHVQDFVTSRPELLLVATVASLCTICLMYSFKDRHPHNLVLLSSFTMCQAYMIGYVVAVYASFGAGTVVVCAFGSSAVLFMGLSVFALVTKEDFSASGPVLMAATTSLLLFVAIELLYPTMLMYGIVASAGILVFCGFVVHDTSLMLHHLGPDDAAIASVQLYLDLINLFLYTLQILQLCDQP